MANTANNYILDKQVFILGGFDPQETNQMIGELAKMVQSLPIHPIYSTKHEQTSPYDTKDIINPIIDIYINSNGGDASILHSISALLSIARSRGAIIRTTVLCNAASCGSLLAVQGTPGFRIMNEYATHMIHFGASRVRVDKEDEIKLATKYMQQTHKRMEDIYLKHTDLTQAQLKKIMKNEHGHLFPDECLQHNICDWVIDTFGNIRGKTR